MRQASEPSVEEILESIKKVIARDNRASAADQRRERETAGMATAPHDDDPADVLDLSELAEDQPDAAPSDPDAPLIDETARQSMQESFAALAVLAEPGVHPQIVRSGETSLEAMTRDLLRPALADWLEKNLPPLVERMVAAEIARIVGKKG
jgi:cell pole-organizing protein PopZ